MESILLSLQYQRFVGFVGIVVEPFEQFIQYFIVDHNTSSVVSIVGYVNLAYSEWLYCILLYSFLIVTSNKIKAVSAELSCKLILSHSFLIEGKYEKNWY